MSVYHSFRNVGCTGAAPTFVHCSFLVDVWVFRLPYTKMSPGNAASILAVIVGMLVLLALLGEYKFVALEPFMASIAKKGYRGRGCVGDDGWMPTASGRISGEEPHGIDEPLEGAKAFDMHTEKVVASSILVPQSTEEAENNWSRTTSEKCFRMDVGEALKKTRNYLQRTNNYPRSHPDDCSAPNHEFVGTFYRPHDGIGATPASGLPFPAFVTQNANVHF